MNLNRFYYRMPLLLCFICCFNMWSFAQPKLEFDLKKPKEFEDRQLGSEKNAAKKFTVIRRFFQNTYTHYNYYFNANNLINEIVENARVSNTEDYTELLPFYNWSVEQTKGSPLIDSILQKCTAGILLHDLRNDWIDNMYLLMGKAYYLRSDFDSASMAFQFLNFSFSKKEKGGYDLPIGSNSEEGSNAFTILSKEKKKYYLTRPPSRNDGFIWQVRNLTDKKNYLDASSLIAILKNDPNFPERLEPELFEAMAYLYYKIEMWDSAGTYLEKAMPMATDPSDKSRRWYLAGQLYQMGNEPAKAAEAYAKCSNMAIDPVMEVYARLNSIRLRKDDDPNIIQENINALVAMAKKDRYYNYRDIIYYATSLFEMERNGFDAAEGYLTKSIASNTDNQAQRSLSWYQLADVRFVQKKYGMAAPPFDSLQLDALKTFQQDLVKARQPGSSQIYEAEKVVSLQDSLLKVADMTEEDRTALVKYISRKLKKEKGIKETEANMGSVSATSLDPNKKADNLFASESGNWYFYEPTRRANGFNSFKEKWGARPNEDNWRRSSALGLFAAKKETDLGGNPDALTVSPAVEDNFDTSDVSFDNLYSRIPLTEERRAKAQNLAINALYKKASALHEKIEDYPEAIKVYEEILRRTDSGNVVQLSLFDLIHCYSFTGDQQKLAATKARLAKDFTGPTALTEEKAKNKNEAETDAAYENVYNLFLEGNFEEALKERKKADSLLGASYWKPQLLYLQAIYYIKNREDSLAIGELKNITGTFKDHPLSEKATRMIDVLGRRKQIEDYLTKLEVKRLEEDEVDPLVNRPTATVISALPTAKNTSVDTAKIRTNTEALQKQIAADKAAADKERAEKELAAQQLAEKEAAEKAKAEKEAAEKELALKQKAEKEAEEKAAAEKAKAEKEAAEKELARKQAEEKEKAEKELAEKQAAEKAALEKDAANRAEAEKALAAKQAAEKEAMEKELARKQAEEKAKAEKEMAAKMAAEKEQAARDLEKKQAAERAEAERLAVEREKAEKEAAIARQKMIDNVTVGKPSTPSPYTINAGDRQIVAIVLEKIDPAYVNEVSYSLTNSGKRNMGETEVSVVKKKIKDGLWLVELHSDAFTNMQASFDYIKYIKPIAQNELINWLDASKYYFITISPANIAEMEKSADASLYYKVLREAVPNKF